MIGIVVVAMIVVSSVLFEYAGVNVPIALAALLAGALSIRALRRFRDLLRRERKGNR